MTLDRKIKWLFGLIILANVIIVLVVALSAFEPPPPKPMPNPNGYDDFIKARTMLTFTTNDYNMMAQEDLKSFVATNATALNLVRVGLDRECRVPNDYSRDYDERVLSKLILLRALAQNFWAEGRLAEMQNRTNAAAQSYLDVVRFGMKSSQGGVMFSKLLGISWETAGREGLHSLSNNVDSLECRKIAQTLENVDTQEFSVKDVFDAESAYVKKIASFGQRIAALVLYKQRQENKSKFLAKFQKNQLGRRQMMMDFAARAYILEKGKPPAAVTDLVPDYLKAIPKDPGTGSNLVLRTVAP